MGIDGRPSLVLQFLQHLVHGTLQPDVYSYTHVSEEVQTHLCLLFHRLQEEWTHYLLTSCSITYCLCTTIPTTIDTINGTVSYHWPNVQLLLITKITSSNECSRAEGVWHHWANIFYVSPRGDRQLMIWSFILYKHRKKTLHLWFPNAFSCIVHFQFQLVVILVLLVRLFILWQCLKKINLTVHCCNVVMPKFPCSTIDIVFSFYLLKQNLIIIQN